MSRSAVAVALLLASASAPAIAQQASPAPSPERRTSDHHEQVPPEIVITALSRSRDDLGAVSVLSGSELDVAARASIGETLAKLPGVSATSFGPNASRPVLRGFQGDRIRVLTDGIGSFDASSSSVDHAVAINPLIAERIEVLRGPAALLYGSSAIGGVVNVLDRRIPRSLPDEPVHFDADLDYATAADERRASGVLDVPFGDGFVVHFDGTWAKSDDLRTGGYLLSRPLREEAAASDEPEIQELAELRGEIPNTASEFSEFAGGLSYIGERGSLGFSVTRLDNLYGVPQRFELEHHEEEEGEEHEHHHGDVRIDMRQTRFDLRAEVEAGGDFLDRIRFRAGYADYRHFELEGDEGEIATRFFNDGMEGRIEFLQRERGGWGGAFGAQYFTRDFTIIGDEAFLPPTSTEQSGLFAAQHFDFGDARAEVGGRFERTDVAATASEVLGAPDRRRSFDALSGSIGGSLALAEGWRLGLNLSHTERAPTAEELFSAGPHLATQAFEVGDPTLSKEKSNGAELTLRGRGRTFSLELSAYYNDFSNFIFQAPTGEEEDELPVFAYSSAGAERWGLEGQINATLAELGGGKLVADLIGDYVRVTLDGIGPAPFIPPLRVLGGLEYQSDRFDARAEVEHVTEQDRIAEFETATPAYTMTNARIEWRPMGKDGLVSFRLAANNIFDVVARRHASFLKDYAPLAGRDIRVGASIRF